MWMGLTLNSILSFSKQVCIQAGLLVQDRYRHVSRCQEPVCSEMSVADGYEHPPSGQCIVGGNSLLTRYNPASGLQTI